MPIDKLREMSDNAVDNQIPGLTNSIEKIDEQIADLSAQQTAVRQMMTQCANEVRVYLEDVKSLDFPGSFVVIGPNFDVTQITDWRIVDSTSLLDVYVYGGIGWDGDEYIVQRINEWAFGYDYIYRDVGLSGTYGLADMQVKLASAKSLLNINLAKYTNSVTIFARFFV